MILHLIKLIRPKQAVKSVFVFAPLFFSFKFLEPVAWMETILAALAFLATAGIVYIFNDICDVEEDRAHPRKCHRPLAAGHVTVFQAKIFALILLATTLILLSRLPVACTVIIAIYALLQIAYTCSLKKQAIIDVLIIAMGFVLRVCMGSYAINVPLSPWIILTTYLLALFLGFGKRYHELSVKGYDDKRHSLKKYSKPLLDRLIGVSCAATLLSYALYAIETARSLDKTPFVYTVVFVVFGLFRYLQVLYIDEGGGEPEKVLLEDKIFLGNGIIWFTTTILILLS